MLQLIVSFYTCHISYPGIACFAGRYIGECFDIRIWKLEEKKMTAGRDEEYFAKGEHEIWLSFSEMSNAG